MLNINRICNCVDAVICNSCLELSHNKKLKMSTLARSTLNFKKKRDIKYFVFLLFIEISNVIINYLIPFIYPIISITKNNSFENKILFSISSYSIIFLDPITAYFIKSFTDFSIYNYQIIKIIILLIMTAVIFGLQHKYQMTLHIIGIILPMLYFT